MTKAKNIERVNVHNFITNPKQTENGVTLTVLVITIAVILILAGVSITAIFDDNGLINKSKQIQDATNKTMQNMLSEVNELENKLHERMNTEQGGGNTETPEEPSQPDITDSELTSNDRTTTDSKTVTVKDTKENQVVVPGGFKVAADSGTSVQQGIVIEDKDGNQFVWIPVSNTNNDGSNKIIKDDGSEVEITLGRYTFATSSPGTPTLVQKGSEYAAVTAANVKAEAETETVSKYRIDSYYYELSDKNRLSNEKGDKTGTNTTAKDLEVFINRTKANKGFYIARYEASYGDGYNKIGMTTEEQYGNAKPLSKVSTTFNTSDEFISFSKGMLWNFITQPQAALVSKNMYSGNSYVESDLVNSYAWDTAIVYIQAMGNTNYANATRGTNTTLKNTGETGDQKCKIFDMAGNTTEWTTEYSTNKGSSKAYPCAHRGGNYCDSFRCTSVHGDNSATSSNSYVSFRPLLYVK